MAITNIKPIKSKEALSNSEKYIANKEKTLYINNAVNYIENMEKTLLEEGTRLVSGYNCDPALFKTQAQMLMENYYQNKTEGISKSHSANYAFHILLSFKESKDELDPRLVQSMAQEFCSELLGDNFIALTAIHMNTDNLHAHILIPSFGIDGLHKYYDNKATFKRMRNIADEIALKNGLDIIINPKEKTGKSHYEYTKEQEGTSWKKQVRQDIVSMAAASSNWAEYVENMKGLGYELSVKETKNKVKRFITYTKDGLSIGDSRLPLECRSEGINNIISKELEKKELNKNRSKQNKSEPYIPLYVPKYDSTGKRLSNLQRLIELMKSVLTTFKDSFYSASMEQLYPSREYYKSYTDKLEKVNEVSELINKYNLSITDELLKNINENRKDKIRTTTLLEREKGITTKLNEIDICVKRYLELKTKIDSLGIQDEQLYLNKSYDAERRRNLVSLDPPSKKQLSQLHKLLSSSDLKLKYDYDQITASQLKNVISYIKNPSLQKPDIVITAKESRLEYLNKKYTNFYDKNLSKLYEKDSPATKSQLKKIDSIIKENPELSFINPEELSKTDSLRIINKYMKNPLESKIVLDKSKTINANNLKALKELQELYPDEFKNCSVELKDFDKKLYQSMYNYLLAKTDTIIPEPQPTKTHSNKIKFSNYDKETQNIIKEYCKLYHYLDSYDINNSNIKSFIDKKAEHDKMFSKLEAEAEHYQTVLKELNSIQTVVNKATDKGYLFGPLYRGNTLNLNEQVKNILMADYQYNSLIQIKNDLHSIRNSRAEVKNFSLDKLEKYKTDYEAISNTQKELLNRLSNVYTEIKHIDIDDLSFNSAEKLLSYIAYEDKDDTKINNVIQSELERLKREEEIKNIQADKSKQETIYK